jgi:hypothetical protein
MPTCPSERACDLWIVPRAKCTVETENGDDVSALREKPTNRDDLLIADLERALSEWAAPVWSDVAEGRLASKCRHHCCCAPTRLSNRQTGDFRLWHETDLQRCPLSGR